MHLALSLRHAFFFLGIMLSLVLAGLYWIPNTLTPLLIAAVLAYAFDPLIDYFEKKGCKRSKVVFWFFLLTAFVFLLFLFIVLPYLFVELSEFLQNAPSYFLSLLAWVSKEFHLETSTLKLKLTQFVQEHYSTESFSKILEWLRISFTETTTFLLSLFSGIMVPIFFYFFLIQIDSMKCKTFQWIPKPYQRFVRIRLQKVDRILSGFIRGQVTLALSLSVLYSLGLILLGVRYGLLIGVIAGILNMVPYLGVTLGIVASLAMVLIQGKGILFYFFVLLLFGLIQLLDGLLLTPHIVGKKLGLHTFTILILILIGGELFGIAGMLFAIPLGGVGRVVFRDLKASYLRSSFYLKATHS